MCGLMGKNDASLGFYFWISYIFQQMILGSEFHFSGGLEKKERGWVKEEIEMHVEGKREKNRD